MAASLAIVMKIRNRIGRTAIHEFVYTPEPKALKLKLTPTPESKLRVKPYSEDMAA